MFFRNLQFVFDEFLIARHDLVVTHGVGPDADLAPSQYRTTTARAL